MSRQLESNRRKDNCVSCKNFKPIKAKDMCQNCWHKVKRRTQPEFYLRTRYTEIKQRCTNEKRKTAKYYIDKKVCTKEEFLKRFLNDKHFLELFNQWIKSGWDYKLSPSVDRIDSSKDYTLDNIQMITHSHNSTKDQIKQEVFVYTKSGELVGHFRSHIEAARKLDLHVANIWKVINGERKTTGGYIFIGGEYENT